MCRGDCQPPGSYGQITKRKTQKWMCERDNRIEDEQKEIYTPNNNYVKWMRSEMDRDKKRRLQSRPKGIWMREYENWTAHSMLIWMPDQKPFHHFLHLYLCVFGSTCARHCLLVQINSGESERSKTNAKQQVYPSHVCVYLSKHKTVIFIAKTSRFFHYIRGYIVCIVCTHIALGVIILMEKTPLTTCHLPFGLHSIPPQVSSNLVRLSCSVHTHVSIAANGMFALHI